MDDKERPPDRQSFHKKRSQSEQREGAEENQENDTLRSSDCGNDVIGVKNINDDAQRRQPRDSKLYLKMPEDENGTSLKRTPPDIRSKYLDLAIFKTPLCLIKTDENGKFSVEKQVLEEIAKIEDTVNVVAIAGPYRTGKSYLLNRLAGFENGFAIGHSTKAVTKGIWAWCLEHPKRQNEVMMLLDTEGIGDVLKGDKENDNNILCLTTLLTGTFVFNMFGILDEKQLKKLAFVAQLSEKIALTYAKPGETLNIIPDIGFFFPSFVLCLRDFTLEMEDDETPDEYMEKCLDIKHGKGRKIQKYNLIRLSIINHFKNRKCFVFDRPATRQHLKHLEALPLEQLSEDFIQDTHMFLEYMYCREPKKLMDDSQFNGRMFSTMTEKYICAIQSGNLPCIDEALTVVSQKENRVAVKTVVEIFKQNIESLETPLPADFEVRYKDIQRFALQMLKKMVVLDDMQEFQRDAEKEMDEIKNNVVQENKRFIQNACERELQSLYDIIIKPKIDKDEYFVQAGYEMYKDDFARIRKRVRQKLHTADSNLVMICVIEFEERFQKQDEKIFLKTNMIEKEIKKKMEERCAFLGQEKSILDEKVELKRKQDEEDMKLYKGELSSERERAVVVAKDRYRNIVLQWQMRENELLHRLKEHDELIQQLRASQASYEKRLQLQKPTMRETVIKTIFSLIPIAGPIGTAIYERYS